MAWYDSFVPNDPSLTQQDRQQLARSGLLQAGLSILANNSAPGVTPIQAISGGILGGLNGIQQGAKQIGDSRYEDQQRQFQAAQQQDQMAQMQKRQKIQDLALQFAKPDGTFDMQGYQQAVAQFDPQTAMELHQNELRNKLTEAQTQQAQAQAKAKQMRTIDSGTNQLTQEMAPDGSWHTIATAPRFAPQTSAASALAQQIELMKRYGATDDDIKARLGIGPQAALGITGATGPEALNGLPQSDRATVQAIVDGRYPIPTGRQAQSPEWQRLIQLANQVDPTLDAGTYKSRAQARQSFTSGKLGEQVKALNTLAGHLQTLNASLDQLDNSDYGILNDMYNMSANFGNSGRAKALGTYTTAAKAVGDEAAKVFAGGQSALGDRQEIAHGLDPNQPNAKLRATLQTYAELVQSRLAALQDQAQQSLGYGSKSLQIVTPKAQDTFRKLSGGDAPSQGLGYKPMQPAGQPAQQNSALMDALNKYGGG